MSAVKNETQSYTQIFDETNPNWERHPEWNWLFLKNVQNRMNDLLQVQGHVFLNDVYDRLGFKRTPEGQIVGWLRDGDGAKYVDFHMTDHQKEEKKPSIHLAFNVDGVMYDKI